MSCSGNESLKHLQSSNTPETMKLNVLYYKIIPTNPQAGQNVDFLQSISSVPDFTKLNVQFVLILSREAW